MGKLGWFRSDVNCNIPTTWRWAREDVLRERWIRLGLTVYGLVFHPHRTFASVDWLRDDHQESVSRWSLVSTPQLISAVCNQPSLPTSFYSVLVSISVFMALSTVFHSINSPENSPLSHFVLLALFLPYWSFQLHISLWKSPSALI